MSVSIVPGKPTPRGLEFCLCGQIVVRNRLDLTEWLHWSTGRTECDDSGRFHAQPGGTPPPPRRPGIRRFRL